MTGQVLATPEDATEQVAALPRRVAHATYALLAWGRDHPYGPHRAGDVVLYDPEAPSAGSTNQALLRAMREHGLVDRWGRGLYSPTLAATLLFPALEARFLDETLEVCQCRHERGDHALSGCVIPGCRCASYIEAPDQPREKES